VCMQCLREIFLLSFDSETTFFWEHIHASHPQAAPQRTPEQLAELGKYSDPDAQVAVRPG
jgi:hypothetical protein